MFTSDLRTCGLLAAKLTKSLEPLVLQCVESKRVSGTRLGKRRYW